MANEKHLKILKQGAQVWNQWRAENPDVRPNLSGADLHWANLCEADLRGADLRGANLHQMYLYQAHLILTDLSLADLGRADLRGAILNTAILYVADLSGADLSQADLRGANLSRADLSGADLCQAKVGHTMFVDLDLSDVKELDTVEHFSPSPISIGTIYLSCGQIPEVFLRGAGVPDTFIATIASLTGQTIQYYSCFISYSSKDGDFAQRLHADLQQQGVRCWFASEDLKSGDKFRPGIYESIQSHDKLLVVLSEHSINSAWVETEVETAFEEESKRQKTVLFPVRLDAAVMETDQAWAADLRRTRHIGDFSQWKDHDSYQRAFDRLLRDLKAEEG